MDEQTNKTWEFAVQHHAPLPGVTREVVRALDEGEAAQNAARRYERFYNMHNSEPQTIEVWIRLYAPEVHDSWQKFTVDCYNVREYEAKAA